MALNYKSSVRTEIPSATSFTSPHKSGRLKKLTGRGWLYRGSWKDRYCVLDGTKLYFFENESSKGNEKSSGVLNLDYFDVCEESKQKDKRAFNIFAVSTSVRGIFDLQTRHLFSAETLPEMTEWIHLIRMAIGQARSNRSRAGRSRERSSQDRTGSLKNTEVSSSDKAVSVSPSSEICGEDGEPRPRVNSEGRLYTPTKHRAKGPTGRRLPQRKSMASKPEDRDGGEEVSAEPYRSQSTSALECIAENETGRASWALTNGPLDLVEGGRSASQNALAYKYSSSSEESLPPANEGKVKRLTRILQIPTAAPPAPHQPLLVSAKNVQRIKQNEQLNNNNSNIASEAATGVSSQMAGTSQWQRSLQSLDTKLSGLEHEMMVTRSDLATVHTSVGKAQAEVDRALVRMDRMTSQIVQIERQLTDVTMEAHRAVRDAEISAKEASEAKADVLRVKEDCERLLAEACSKYKNNNNHAKEPQV